MPFLEEQSTSMNAQLGSTQQSNVDLLAAVLKQRGEIEALVNGLESVIQDLEASAQIMGQDDVQGLTTDIRDLELEMKK